jgi:hypothetical protein
VYHRCLKILQIACLVYIGAASGNWNPGDIQDPDTLGVTGGYAADRGELEAPFSSAHSTSSATLLPFALLDCWPL